MYSVIGGSLLAIGGNKANKSPNKFARSRLADSVEEEKQVAKRSTDVYWGRRSLS